MSDPVDGRKIVFLSYWCEGNAIETPFNQYHAMFDPLIPDKAHITALRDSAATVTPICVDHSLRNR